MQILRIIITKSVNLHFEKNMGVLRPFHSG